MTVIHFDKYTKQSIVQGLQVAIEYSNSVASEDRDITYPRLHYAKAYDGARFERNRFQIFS